jgi:hypothetical protein
MHISEIICHIKLHIKKVEQNAVIHNHNTSQKLNILVQFYSTDAPKKGVVNMEIKLYGKLSYKIREVKK